MNITLDDLYRLIGQLYVSNHVLTERVKVLTPVPLEEPPAEGEVGIVDYARHLGGQ